MGSCRALIMAGCRPNMDDHLTGQPVLITTAPPIDRLVVCHADARSPTTLIGPDGVYAGHVDLGNLGPADRWANLAVATNNRRANYSIGIGASAQAPTSTCSRGRPFRRHPVQLRSPDGNSVRQQRTTTSSELPSRRCRAP